MGSCAAPSAKGDDKFITTDYLQQCHLRRERQMEGIAAAKARGVYRGRKPSIDPAEVYRLYTIEKMGATAIARQLGIGRASVYRALENYEQPA
ncbi:recombinase family protein [Salmonella enterica subsp. enterica serovar Dublin]|nr:recombinase family protein [Salmonella enterica subsp. enterica serovar Dublin]